MTTPQKNHLINLSSLIIGIVIDRGWGEVEGDLCVCRASHDCSLQIDFSLCNLSLSRLVSPNTHSLHTHIHTQQLDIVSFVDKYFFLIFFINYYKQTTKLKEYKQHKHNNNNKMKKRN